MCKNCQAKDKIIAKFKRILKKAQICDEEKYHRIKWLEDRISQQPNATDGKDHRFPINELPFTINNGTGGKITLNRR